MTAPPLVVPILATPFGVVPLPEAGNRALLEVFAARRRVGGAASTPVLRHQSRDDLLEWPEPPVRALGAAMLEGVHAVIESVNQFPEGQLRSFKMEARAWFTIVEKDGAVPATAYPMTAWCAIYCVAAPEPAPDRQDSGILRLYESRGSMYQDATTAVMNLPYRTGHYGWRPVAGQMAVFPASLTHEIALLRSQGPLVLVTARVRFIAPGQQGMPRW